MKQLAITQTVNAGGPAQSHANTHLRTRGEVGSIPKLEDLRGKPAQGRLFALLDWLGRMQTWMPGAYTLGEQLWRELQERPPEDGVQAPAAVQFFAFSKSSSSATIVGTNKTNSQINPCPGPKPEAPKPCHRHPAQRINFLNIV